MDIPKIFYTKKGFYEDVSDLNGIAIPAFYYDSLQKNEKEGQNSIKRLIRSSITDMKDNEHGFLRKKVEDIPRTCKSIKEYLYLANVYVAIQEKLYFKLKQLQKNDYVWLKKDVIEKCKLRLHEFLGEEFQNKSPEIEKTLIHYNNEDLQLPLEKALFPYFGNEKKFKFCARLDLLSKTHLYEIKCTSNVTLEHKLQLVLYAWIWTILYPDEQRELQLFNIRNNEVWKLKNDWDHIHYIVIALLKYKYDEKKGLEKEDFITQCQSFLESFEKKGEDYENIESDNEKKTIEEEKIVESSKIYEQA